MPLSEWVRRIDSVSFASCDLDGFSSVDDILTTETLKTEDNCDGSKEINKTVHLQEENFEEQEIEVNMPTINEALQVIKVVHNFYEATSENVQVIRDLERIERDLQMQYFATRKQTQITDFFNACRKCEYYTYFICFMFCFVIATLRYNNIIPLAPLIVL